MDTEPEKPQVILLSVEEKQVIGDAPGSLNLNKPRLYYVDKLRTYLTLLVVVHHCFWVVVEGWLPFYRPWEVDQATLVVSYMILSGDQAYFMGLFFFLAGLVTGPSLKRKGSWIFLKDRFYRLMIPAIAYDLVFFPLLMCFVQAAWYGPQGILTVSFGEVWARYFGELGKYIFSANQMWFTVTLFTFSLIAVGILVLFTSWKKFVFTQHSIEAISQKAMMMILIKTSLILVVLNYLLRIPFPDGYAWIPVVANTGFIMQYIVAFTAGILANSYQFLDHIRKQHLLVTLSCSIIFYFVFQVFQTFLFDKLRETMGFYLHVLLITIFEQFFAVFWSYSLLVLFKEYQNGKPSHVFSRLIGSAYAAYIVQQWIVIPSAVGLAYTNIPPFAVILVLIATSPFFAWGVGLLLKAIPGANKVL
jgi:hypothetical protein